MRHYILFILSGICLAWCGHVKANTVAKDSLMRILAGRPTPQMQVKVYRDLADIYFEMPLEKVYLWKMYETATKIGDTNTISSALAELAFIMVRANCQDSVNYYLSLLKPSCSGEQLAAVTSFIKMRMFDYDMYDPNTSMTKNSGIGNSKLYTEIERSYILGAGLYIRGKSEQSLPHLLNALRVAQSLPPEHSFKYQSVISYQLVNAHFSLRQASQGVAVVEELIARRELNYEHNYRKQRPFYHINTMMVSDCALMLSNMPLLDSAKIKQYLAQIIELTDHSTNPYDLYRRYISINNYHLQRREYAKALPSNDSLIKLAAIIAPYNLAVQYDVSSKTYQAIGQYQEALHRLQISHKIKDSLESKLTQQKLHELQVKYDVDKLKYENTELENENRKIALVAMGIMLVFSFAISISIYLYYSLSKVKRMKKRLEILRAQAMQSENMKTAFVNSMCHEIRTPLNAIVGFSDMIYEEELDAETKKEFATHIRQNTFMLTSLINNMLEVSKLYSSQETLPCEESSLNEICVQQMDLIRDFAKPSLEYITSIPEDDLTIITHPEYLGLVIGQLLENANKFTDKGSVTLSYIVDKAENNFTIAVFDTGCGIPIDKHEEVFIRFSKLNSFTQGSGLGLYMCRLITSRLNGTIRLDSTYVDGAKFLMTFPITQ